MRALVAPIRFSDLLIFFSLFAIIAISFAFQSTFDWRGRATDTPAIITVDTSVVGDEIDTSFYHSFAQGGAEPTDMLSPIVSQIKGLHPKMIRVDHIYDGYGVVSKTGSALGYDWTKLDNVVDSIVKTGALPVLSLSYMPPSIAMDGVVIHAPTDWNLWEQVVAETIRHYSGVKAINAMRYEVWNEPDLGQFGGWKYYGNKNYMTMYMHASDAANQVRGVKKFYFGGPAITSYYEAWVQSVLGSGNRVDFISWHVYDPRPKTIANHMEKYTALLALHPSFGQVPVYITEYGHAGEKSPLYGTAYEAVFTAAVVRQLMDVPIKPQLFAFQLKDAKDDTNGWGMISHESKGAVPKPRYYALSFLDRMKGKRLSVSGEGSSVTGYASIDGATIRVLLINVDPENPNGTHPQNVPITFSRLVAGDYTLKRSKFLGKETTSSFSITSDSAELSVYMPANSMEILEVTKVSR